MLFLTPLLCFNYSIIFSNDHFSAFDNSTKEMRLPRLLSLKLRCPGVAINRPDLQTAARTDRRCDILVLFVARCTLVKNGAMQSG